MVVYRIAKEKYIRDLSGAGARIYGGRWNKKGTGVIYTSESRALATVEFLVHLPLTSIPPHVKIAAFTISEPVPLKEIDRAHLPAGWKDYPAPPELAAIGTKWILDNEAILLRVPSVVIENEYNILINPSHPEMSKISISSIEDFILDDRLLKRK